MRMNLEMTGIDHEPLVIRRIHKSLQKLFPDPFVSPSDKPKICIRNRKVRRKGEFKWLET